MAGFDQPSIRMPVAVHIIEDDPAVCDAVRELIAGEGRRVFTYFSPASFLAGARLDERDIVILDLHFPLESGVDLARRLKRERPSAPIVVISGIRVGPYKRAVAEIRPAASFRKPLDGPALAECVNRLINAT